MKKCILFVFLIFCLLFSGCSTPFIKWFKTEKSIAKVEEKIVTNQDSVSEKGKGFVWAADYSLSLNPSNNIYTSTAKDFTSRALISFGSPEMVEVIQLREIVNNLTSSNALLTAKGIEQLNKKDKEVISLQNNINKLESELKIKEGKLKEVNQENAGLASKWVTLKRIFWWIIYGIIGVIIFKILAVILPPPYNSIFGIFDYIIGGLIRGIFKLAPKAMESAKVVGKDVQTALDHVVTSIQETKSKIDSKNESSGEKSVGLEVLKSELNKNTDDTSKIIITQTKQDLGYI